MRAFLIRNPLLAIALGYVPAIAGAWWLLSEALAGRFTGLLMVGVAFGAFFLGFRTSASALPAPEAADAADPLPQPAAPAVQSRPVVARFGTVNGS